MGKGAGSARRSQPQAQQESPATRDPAPPADRSPHYRACQRALGHLPAAGEYHAWIEARWAEFIQLTCTTLHFCNWPCTHAAGPWPAGRHTCASVTDLATHHGVGVYDAFDRWLFAHHPVPTEHP